MAAHCSQQGAERATARASTQTLRYLELLAKCGPQSDAEAARLLGIERSSVNARRACLVNRGIVVAVDVVKNQETGIANCRWGLCGNR